MAKMSVTYFYPYEENLRLHYKAFDLLTETEYEMTHRGYRPVSIFHMVPENFDKEMEKILNDGMFFLPIDRAKRYQGVATSYEITSSLTPEDSFVYGVIARDLEDARAFKKAHVANDHVKMGELLGYPTCCTRFFSSTWPKFKDPIFELACNTRRRVDPNYVVVREDNPLLRVHMRYFGFRVIPWFPCSTLCQESSKLVEDWIETMRSIDEKTTNKIIEFLEMPSKWSLSKSQVIVEHPRFWGFSGSVNTSQKLEVQWG